MTWDRFEGQRTEAQCKEAWVLFEHMCICIKFGAPEELVEQCRIDLDRELLLSYIED